ncbi:MAG: hypothetical protein IT184_10970 [Acidobacteria bacterium]|nr:hypothetical protein [Acidobacteriota bacterium]
MRVYRARAGECGSAVLLAVMVLGCVLAASAGLMTLSASDRAMSANFRDDARVAYAADAIGAYVVGALKRAGGFGAALQADARSGLSDSSRVVRTSWGNLFDLEQETTTLQERTNRRWPRGGDTPVWRLFAWSALDRLIPAEAAASCPYLAAWVADNPTDGDGDSNLDSDGIVMVRAQARLGRRVRTLELFVTTRAPDSPVSAGHSPAGEDAETTPPGVAQFLPQQDVDSTSAGVVRVMAWREAP